MLYFINVIIIISSSSSNGNISSILPESIVEEFNIFSCA